MRIALTGNPNSGKTTMFNAITGRKERVGNWAGVTVDKKESAIKTNFSDGDEQQFTDKDFRFTYKNGYLYAFQMRPSKNVEIKTLKKHTSHDYLIESVELLGSNEKIEFTRDEDSLKINIKSEIKNDLPICFKIELG